MPVMASVVFGVGSPRPVVTSAGTFTSRTRGRKPRKPGRGARRLRAIAAERTQGAIRSHRRGRQRGGGRWVGAKIVGARLIAVVAIRRTRHAQIQFVVDQRDVERTLVGAARERADPGVHVAAAVTLRFD